MSKDVALQVWGRIRHIFALLCWPTVMTPSRHRRLVLAYDSNPSSDGSVLVSATPPARHHYCPPTPLRPRPHPQSRVESGHALSHTTTCHLSTSWRIRMNISRCVPGRERQRGCIVPTRTPARARRRSGANGASTQRLRSAAPRICSERLIVPSWPAGTSGEADHVQPSSPPEAAVAAISAGLVTAPPRQVRV